MMQGNDNCLYHFLSPREYKCQQNNNNKRGSREGKVRNENFPSFFFGQHGKLMELFNVIVDLLGIK